MLRYISLLVRILSVLSHFTLSLRYRWNMGLVAGKPVFGVSDKASFKPVSSATVTSQKIEISLVASLDMILSNKRITKALIRLRGRAGWSAPVLFANPRRQVFSCRGPYDYSLYSSQRVNILYLKHVVITLPGVTSYYDKHRCCQIIKDIWDAYFLKQFGFWLKETTNWFNNELGSEKRGP